MMTGGSQKGTFVLRLLASIAFSLAVCLVLACAPAVSKPSVSGSEGMAATVSSFTGKLFPAPDEDLFCDGIAHLGRPGQTSDCDRAKAAFAAILQSYPKSKWAEPARICLGLIEEKRASIERSALDEGQMETLRREKEGALRNKESLKLANEKLQTEVERLSQENEQLKKDIQLLKELEIQLEKRDRMLRSGPS